MLFVMTCAILALVNHNKLIFIKGSSQSVAGENKNHYIINILFYINLVVTKNNLKKVLVI